MVLTITKLHLIIKRRFKSDQPVPSQCVLARYTTPKAGRSCSGCGKKLAYPGLRHNRKLPTPEARELAELYYKVECLSRSKCFNFVIRKKP